MKKSVKILIVDDSPITRNLLLQILQKNPNFEVVGMAFNGKDAVSMAKLYCHSSSGKMVVGAR